MARTPWPGARIPTCPSRSSRALVGLYGTFRVCRRRHRIDAHPVASLAVPCRWRGYSGACRGVSPRRTRDRFASSLSTPSPPGSPRPAPTLRPKACC
eukprot:scaffold148662_cov47-Prasinocladus_malaysianus.AAC.2